MGAEVRFELQPILIEIHAMESRRERLLAAAKAVIGEFALRRGSAGTVSAAVLAAYGQIYTGVCIDLACGLGFCAETAALAEMLKARETHVIAVVAVRDGVVAGAPCGRCRETLAQIDERNLDCMVILNRHEIPLRQLLPEHWLSGQ